MQIIPSISALRTRLESETKVALVPTMGNIHDGHLALVKPAQQNGTCTVASIFVNRAQFGPKEDFALYPRTLDADYETLRTAGVDIVFCPSEVEIYSEPQTMMVDLPSIANELCGAFRPGHFRAVATIVLKLFNIVQPQVAIFGKKDYQQLVIIRDMVRQFNLPIDIVACETTRAHDGLALSSRNQYLDRDERTESVRLYQCLNQIRQAITTGERDYALLLKMAKNVLEQNGWKVDYVELRETNNLNPANRQSKALVVLAAALLGKTRLIDNLEICIE